MLRADGWAVLQVPVHSSLEHTLEDPDVTDPGERERLFGQRDHVRRYGRDYPQRLEACGFSVTRDRFFDELAPDERLRLGLKGETLHLCRRA